MNQTARGLGITIKTVENLQSRLFRKLEARNRAQAVAIAHARGLLDRGPDVVVSQPADGGHALCAVDDELPINEES